MERRDGRGRRRDRSCTISVSTTAILLFIGSFARAQTVEYIHTDALGSPVAVTDANGAVIERTVYEPYGAVINRPLNNRPGYTGHVEDAVTGLNYMQQRYYDPQLGRFLSNDPVTASSVGGNFNRYWYANGNPYAFIDPDGRDACPDDDKNCIEDPKTETPDQAPPGGHPVTEEQQKIDEVVVMARKEKRIGDQRIEFDLPYPQEQYGSIEGVTVTAVRGKQERKYTCTDGSSGASNVLNSADFAGADAAVHTHPNWADPSPGMDDGGAIPGALGIPNYGIFRVGAWAIERTPSGYRARLISGRWGSSRASVQAAVRGYNTGAGRGSSGRTCTYQQ